MADDHIFVRIATLSEGARQVERIYKFYRENPSDFINTRQVKDVVAELRSGHALIIENRRKEIEGVSFMFDRGGADLEFGGTRIVRQGFGLQRLLLNCRLAIAGSYDLFSSHCFCVVMEENDRSAKNIVAVGIPERNDLFDTFMCYGLEQKVPPDKRLFVIGRDDLRPGSALAEQVRAELLHLHAMRCIVVGGKKLFVTLDFELMRNDVLRNGLLKH